MQVKCKFRLTLLNHHNSTFTNAALDQIKIVGLGQTQWFRHNNASPQRLPHLLEPPQPVRPPPGSLTTVTTLVSLRQLATRCTSVVVKGDEMPVGL